MYTINMADSTGLFIVLMIFCVMSITSSIFFTYTCTDGTWDFDNFKGEQCVKLPEEEEKPDPLCSTFTTDSDCPLTCTWDTTTSSCNEPPITNNPQNVTYGYGTYLSSLMSGDVTIPKSEHYISCSSMFFIDETTTCFDKDADSAAITWVFTARDNTNTCLSKISYFRVYISFSSNPDIMYYVDKASTERHFHFKGAPGNTVLSNGTDNTITFTVHAMDKNNKLMAPEIQKSVKANDSADTCANMGVGMPEDWDDAMTVYIQQAVELEETKSCEGGTYVTDESYGCRNNGGVYETVFDVMSGLCGPSCYIKQDLVGHTPPTGGGSCLLVKYPYQERASCNDPASQEDLDRVVDCVLSPAVPAPLNDNSEPYNAVGINGTCSKACGTEGVQRQVQRIAVMGVNTGLPCVELATDEACNRFTCGQDCKGTNRERDANNADACFTHYSRSGKISKAEYASSIKEWTKTQDYKSGPLGPDDSTTAQTCNQKYSSDVQNLKQGWRPKAGQDQSAAWIDC